MATVILGATLAQTLAFKMVRVEELLPKNSHQTCSKIADTTNRTVNSRHLGT